MLERNAHSNQGRLMLSFYTLDVSVQENITRFSIEYFLRDLAKNPGSPDQWQMRLRRPRYRCVSTWRV